MNKKLLVVDDNREILSIIKEALIEKDITIFTSENPIHALHIFFVERPQIVLSDLKLGTGMDGLTMCGKMRTKIPKTITIAMTGYLTSYDLNYCLGSGMFSDAITKPFELDLLIKIIFRWFEKRERWDLVRPSFDGMSLEDDDGSDT